MLCSLLVVLALSGAPAPAASSALPVSGTYDGRGRVHAVEATLDGARLSVHGKWTGPSPLPRSRRAVLVEVLSADGAVLVARTVETRRHRAVVPRRRPVETEFTLTLEGVAGAASLRIGPAR